MKDFKLRESGLMIPLLAVTLGFFATVANAQNQAPKISQRPAQVTSAHETEATEVTAPESANKRLVTQQEAASDSELASLRDAISAAPNNQERTRLQLQLVEYLVGKGKKQEAIIELKSMSDEQGFNPQGFYNIANAQARLGDSEGAVRSYRKAIDQRKGRYSRAANNLGVVLMRLGRWEESYEALLSALRQESFRYAEASYNLGRLYAARGETDLSVREWRRALAVDPEHAATAKALANAGSAGNITAAAPARGSFPKTIAPSGENARSTDAKQPAANTRERSAEDGASLKSRASGTGGFTVDPDTYSFLQRGREARDRGRNNEAVENYRRVLKRMGGYFPPANLELGYTFIALNRNDEAMASLLPVAIRNGEQFPISYYHVARLYESSGQLKLAEENYFRAAESYGQNNSQFLLDLSRVREKQGNVSGALTSLEQYLNSLSRESQKPEWSDQRLAELRSKLAASTARPKQ